MHSYKSYINSKQSLINENKQDKVSQILGLEKMIADGSIRTSTWTWNERENHIDFDSDLIIDYDFAGPSLLDLPFKIGWVEGDFIARGVDALRDIKGAPKSSYGFNISYGHLTSLDGAPQTVNDFNMDYNMIRSLSGCPKYVFGDFHVEANPLKSLNFGPYLITGTIFTPKSIKKEDSVLFKQMHNDIKNHYLNVSSEDKTISSIESDIHNKKYVPYLIGTNPLYSKFLGSFPEERDELDFMKTAQNYGLI